MMMNNDDRPNAPAVLNEVETMARRYIRRHADDPSLSGSTVAHALGWSLRQVQLALQKAGTTPRKLIMEERLKVARDRLRSPAYRHLEIGELATQLGFSSASNFSTAFRRRFGIRPRDVRNAKEPALPPLAWEGTRLIDNTTTSAAAMVERAHG